MRVTLFKPLGKIVRLTWWRFCHLHYATLVEMQNLSPNQVVEIVEEGDMEGVGRYVPLHNVNLDSYQFLATINL